MSEKERRAEQRRAEHFSKFSLFYHDIEDDQYVLTETLDNVVSLGVKHRLEDSFQLYLLRSTSIAKFVTTLASAKSRTPDDIDELQSLGKELDLAKTDALNRRDALIKLIQPYEILQSIYSRFIALTIQIEMDRGSRFFASETEWGNSSMIQECTQVFSDFAMKVKSACEELMQARIKIGSV